MNLLGVSGLANSMPFKRQIWPDLDERELRISQGHDSAAVLVCDGVTVAAAAEERFTRNKHTGAFPISAIRYCLSQVGLSIKDVDLMAHAFDYRPYRDLMFLDPVTARQYEEVFSPEAFILDASRHLSAFPVNRIVAVNHLLAHAASAYFTSGWDECLVIVIDGMGEAHCVTVFHGHDGKLERIRQLPAQDSIGILYSLVTLHLGFDFNADEYKIMGLAPYGDAERFRPFFNETVELLADGKIRIPILRLNKTRDERQNHIRTRKHLAEHLVKERRPEEEVTDTHRDVAASLQACLDRTMEHLCAHFARKLGLRRLAMAGGVALNCTANGKLLRSSIFD